MSKPNFLELRLGEVRRILIPRTSVNKGKKEWQEVLYLLKDKAIPDRSKRSASQPLVHGQSLLFSHRSNDVSDNSFTPALTLTLVATVFIVAWGYHRCMRSPSLHGVSSRLCMFWASVLHQLDKDQTFPRDDRLRTRDVHDQPE
jgi:hypothetical protein